MRAGWAGWMGEDSRTGRFWPVIILLAALVMGLCVLVHRHLYADGAWFLTMILRDRDFTTFDAPRQYAHFVLEAPLYAAMNWLNITNMRVLSWIFGGALFLTPVASLWLCWRILGRRNRSWMVLPVFTWVGLTLTTSIFIISESWLGIAVFWPLYFLLFYRRHALTTLEGLFLVAGALTTIRIYEGFLIPGSLLLFLAVRRVRWQWAKQFQMDGWAGGAALCLVATEVMTFWWGLFPRDPGNRVSLFKGLGHLVTYPGTYLVAGAALVILGPRAFRSRGGRILGVAVVVAAFAWAAKVWFPPAFVAASRHADLRLLNNLLPFGLGLLPFLAARRPAYRPTFDGARRLLFAGFTMAVLVWQAGSCWVWAGFLRDFSRTLEARPGFVTYQEAGLARYGFDWGWTWPCMSVVLRGIEGRPVKGVVLNPAEDKWQPFNPRNSGDLPKLDRYGVVYALPPSPVDGH